MKRGEGKCTANEERQPQSGNCISHHALESTLEQVAGLAQSRSARAMRWVSTSASVRILQSKQRNEII